MKTERASLYFCEGNSDKEYHVEIVEKNGNYIVLCAWGRRGGTLQTGTKTQEPVPLEKAKAIFDKLVREKTAKGYSPGAAGTPYQQTVSEDRTTGILPQLLNPVDEQDAERLIRDSDYWMQEKFDGKRMLIRREQGLVSGINRAKRNCGQRECCSTISAPDTAGAAGPAARWLSNAVVRNADPRLIHS